MEKGNLSRCLSALEQSGVEFILVGGLAAVLQGAPINTYDVDIVYSRAPENITSVLAFLNSIDAIFRIQPNRRLKANETHLQGTSHLNLMTRFGALDLLATIGEGLTYDHLLPQSHLILIAEAVRIRVLNLDKIIAIKEILGSEKDTAMLPILRQTARESRKSQG